MLSAVNLIVAAESVSMQPAVNMLPTMPTNQLTDTESIKVQPGVSSLPADNSAITESATVETTNIVLPKVTESTSMQSAVHLLPASVPTDSVSNQSVAIACESKRDKSFPFSNTSFPGDPDSDILDYPTVNVEKKARKTGKLQNKYFILISAEALAAKVKAAEEKKKKDEKVERQKQREQKKNEKELQKISKEQKSKTGGANRSNKGKKNKQPLDVAEVAQDYYCIYCNDKYEEPPAEDWIMCDTCKKWAHESCSGLQRKTKFVCVKCK